ncbi:nucleotidyltransferase [Roseivirga sp. 4D4]|uniref:nucleotidyl transferase AbiEii/AbiGii toxin family protein n=1 Tax=Roseivirga sp. 4D4 TaxID=1889784 RepID=UPI000853EC71|nr:nucleotidyl transferase AbiEii/AbiGii toxin family protein [Roseivirga sp. 4D4]OEK03024.1 nucleotidyltransferase [Roseivirga sp. 4D4]
MAREPYKNQVSLLLVVLPEVAKEPCFALHGGTAINLFVREMPRLSVDIDLTYIPLEDRETSLQNIGDALENIQKRIEKVISKVQIELNRKTSKLQISQEGAQIKLEVNQTNRGVLVDPSEMALCGLAQEEFEAFCVMPIVSLGQLYGGKVCAALDRQHPRDLFDVKYLLDNEGFTDEVKEGFLLFLLCSNRPIHVLLNPNLQDQRRAMENQFEGMTEEPFSYEQYEETRIRLIKTIQGSLTEMDKAFLLGVKELAPDWSIYDFERFPGVQWKMRNLEKLKTENPNAHLELLAKLNKVLGREG